MLDETSKLSDPREEVPRNYPCACTVEFTDKNGQLRQGTVSAVRKLLGGNEKTFLRIEDLTAPERIFTTDEQGQETSYIPFDERIRITHDPYKKKQD